MKYPFWLANSLLFICMIGTILFVGLSRVPKTHRVPFEPEVEPKPIKKGIAKIDPSKIYTNDLFGTYVLERPPAFPISDIKPVPPPPVPRLIQPPPPPPPKFLEPLQITLKGIILTGKEDDNRVIIEDNKTKVAHNYKLGQKVEDAQLMRIFKNKVMLIRSNGQQETLYVNQFDAKTEQLLKTNNWDSVVKNVAPFVYQINPFTFVKHIRSLAELIDILNLTTVYQKGQSIGCRIGKLENGSLGYALGLQPGDIVATIADIQANNTENRFAIYKKISVMELGDTIKVAIIRQNLMTDYFYRLEDFAEKTTTAPLQKTTSRVLSNPEIERDRILKERAELAQANEQMLKQMKRDILNKANPSAAKGRAFLNSFPSPETLDA